MAFDTLQEIVGNFEGAVDIFGNSARAFGDVADGVTSIKSLFSGTKSPSKVDVDRTIFEIERKVLEAEKANFALETALLDVQRKLAEAQNQTSKLSRYSLTKFQTGDVAYKFDAADSDGEPAHYICATCYEDGLRSILHGDQVLRCTRCRGSGTVMAR